MTGNQKSVVLAIAAALMLAAAWESGRRADWPTRSSNARGEAAAPVSEPAVPRERLGNFIVDSESGSLRSVKWKAVEDFPVELAVFETVFWDPRDTSSLRELIRSGSIVRGKSILEIGTGSGLLALCCLEAQAAHVVATDVNQAALDNAAFNAKRLGLEDGLELRLVPLENAFAYSVIGGHEQFDLIISNPPWENERPGEIEDYAYFDPGYELLRSLLDGLETHLKPGGRALLAYGARDAIEMVIKLAEERHLDVKILDERDAERLPDEFLPGMLLEVTPRETTSEPRRLNVANRPDALP